MIKDLVVGSETYLVGLVKTLKEAKTKNGDAYIDMEVADRTGSIGVKIWSTSEEDLGDLGIGSGSLIYAKGRVSEYRSVAQFTVDTSGGRNIVNVKNYPDLEAKYKIGDYIPTAPISYDQIKSYLLWALGQIGDRDLRDFAEKIFTDNEEKLISYPASTNVHHEYLNGLGYHIYRMMKQVFALREVYGGSVNFDYLIVGVLVHDIGKTRCYEINEIGLPEGYTLANDLHGHLAIGYQMVEEYDLPREKKDLVQHLVLSHHGKREFGAVTEPMTMEAHILHFIDNLDSTVTMVEKELDKLDDEEVSRRIWYLDNTKLYKAPKDHRPLGGDGNNIQ